MRTHPKWLFAPNENFLEKPIMTFFLVSLSNRMKVNQIGQKLNYITLNYYTKLPFESKVYKL